MTILVYLMEIFNSTCVSDVTIYCSMKLLTQQKSSACLIPGTTKDQSGISLLMHRTEFHYSDDGKGLANLKAWQHILDDPSQRVCHGAPWRDGGGREQRAY